MIGPETSVGLVARYSNKFSRQGQHRHFQNESVKRSQVSTCYNCGKAGYNMKSDCYRCYLCKRKWHTSKNCFKNNGRPNFRRTMMSTRNKEHQELMTIAIYSSRWKD